MAAPVIDPTTSVLSWTRGRLYSFQPALTASSAAATSWAIQSGGLPSGVTLNTSTGLISGTPDLESEGSVFRANLVATNGDGTSEALPLVIGVRVSAIETDAGLHATMDLDSGAVVFRGHPQRDEIGRAIVNMREGDECALTVRFTRDGQAVDLVAESIRVTVDEYEPEGSYLLHADGDDLVVHRGDGETGRCVTWLDLSGADLAGLLSNWEDDNGTAAVLLAQMEITTAEDMGEEEARTSTRRSLPFWLALHRAQTIVA